MTTDSNQQMLDGMPPDSQEYQIAVRILECNDKLREAHQERGELEKELAVLLKEQGRTKITIADKTLRVVEKEAQLKISVTKS